MSFAFAYIFLRNPTLRFVENAGYPLLALKTILIDVNHGHFSHKPHESWTAAAPAALNPPAQMADAPPHRLFHTALHRNQEQ
jgi:hypothetical protein